MFVGFRLFELFRRWIRWFLCVCVCGLWRRIIKMKESELIEPIAKTMASIFALCLRPPSASLGRFVPKSFADVQHTGEIVFCFHSLIFEQWIKRLISFSSCREREGRSTCIRAQSNIHQILSMLSPTTTLKWTHLAQCFSSANGHISEVSAHIDHHSLQQCRMNEETRRCQNDLSVVRQQWTYARAREREVYVRLCPCNFLSLLIWHISPDAYQHPFVHCRALRSYSRRSSIFFISLDLLSLRLKRLTGRISHLFTPLLFNLMNLSASKSIVRPQRSSLTNILQGIEQINHE